MRKFCPAMTLCAIMLLASTAVWSQVPVFSEFEHSDRLKPIYKSRVLRVDDERHRIALSLLGGKNFLALSSGQIADLFPDRRVDVSAMLKEEIAVAIAYAEKREREYSMPFFSSLDWMKRTAELHRAHAAYLRTLFGRLSPYLVKSEVYSEGTGGNSVTLDLDKGIMTVGHGSLGRGPVSRRFVPIVVFAERSVENVIVKVSAAQ
jgi:hypothetical protein